MVKIFKYWSFLVSFNIEYDVREFLNCILYLTTRSVCMSHVCMFVSLSQSWGLGYFSVDKSIDSPILYRLILTFALKSMSKYQIIHENLTLRRTNNALKSIFLLTSICKKGVKRYSSHTNPKLTNFKRKKHKTYNIT